MGSDGCIPVLDRGCCGCCELSTCVKTQGIINIIGSILNLVISALALAVIQEVADKKNPTDAEEAAIIVGRVIIALIIIGSLISLILAILLLRGVQTENRALLLPYMITTSVLILFNFCVNISSLAESSVNVGSGVFQLLWTTALQLYFLLHVYSYYVQLGTTGGVNYA